MSRANTARFSECGRYRYNLTRMGGPGLGATAVIMVNPSTADADVDDATIRKVIGFGRVNNWGAIVVVNLFAYRATDIKELAHVDDPVGPKNAAYIANAMDCCDKIIVAWGAQAKLPRRLRDQFWQVVSMAGFREMDLHCIGTLLADGHPRHPLMAGYELPILRWHPPGE